MGKGKKMIKKVNFDALVGKTFEAVKVGDEQIDFVCTDGSEYSQYHNQDCCESVYIEDVCGDIDDLIGSPILSAEEVTNADAESKGGESETWTFYHLKTVKGTVTIRWYGTSNGYYSESVSFYQVK